MRLVNGARVVLVEDETLVAGSIKTHRAEFDFDSSWDEYTTKKAVFKHGDIVVEQLILDGVCEVPWEVLEQSGTLLVGVYGESADKRRPTLWAGEKTVNSGVIEGGEAKEPTPDAWQQLLTAIGDITPYVGENGNWYVGEADTGVKAQGEQGERGAPGDDYIITDEDKKEISADVATELTPISKALTLSSNVWIDERDTRIDAKRMCVGYRDTPVGSVTNQIVGSRQKLTHFDITREWQSYSFNFTLEAAQKVYPRFYGGADASFKPYAEVWARGNGWGVGVETSSIAGIPLYKNDGTGTAKPGVDYTIEVELKQIKVEDAQYHLADYGASGAEVTANAVGFRISTNNNSTTDSDGDGVKDDIVSTITPKKITASPEIYTRTFKISNTTTNTWFYIYPLTVDKNENFTHCDGHSPLGVGGIKIYETTNPENVIYTWGRFASEGKDQWSDISRYNRQTVIYDDYVGTEFIQPYDFTGVKMYRADDAERKNIMPDDIEQQLWRVQFKNNYPNEDVDVMTDGRHKYIHVYHQSINYIRIGAEYKDAPTLEAGEYVLEFKMRMTPWGCFYKAPVPDAHSEYNIIVSPDYETSAEYLDFGIYAAAFGTEQVIFATEYTYPTLDLGANVMVIKGSGSQGLIFQPPKPMLYVPYTDTKYEQIDVRLNDKEE